MLDKSNLIICFIILIVQEFATSEWVELPQFSNGAKVYRMPLAKHDSFGQKYYPDNRNRPEISKFSKTHEHGNATLTDDISRRPLKRHYQLAETSAASILFDVRPSTSVVTAATMKNVDMSHEHNIEDVIVENEKEDILQAMTAANDLDDDSIIDAHRLDEAVVEDKYQSEGESNEPKADDKNKKPNFLAYLPMELFKKVHNILKSQSTTTEGKIDFLKRFEKTLVGEIEKRLVPVFTSVSRSKRQARGDYGWDDNEKSVGFPSLEGALMAIAFLTFAVYLVQLVMMLFPNLGTRGVSAILFNRNRRSVDEFTEDTARILAYLDEYTKHQYFQ